MESPPACSTWSEAFPSSEDSGLLLTSGHSGSVSSGSCAGALALEEESDDDGKSLSAPETLSDGAADEEDEDDENFNTLKKGPGWPTALAPPPEFQDHPPLPIIQPVCIQKFASQLVAVLLEEALLIACKATWSIHCSQECHPGGVASLLGEASHFKSCWSGPRLCWTPELPPATVYPTPAIATARLGSHTSLASSRLSSSHNSLAVPAVRGDDSSAFITSAMSHDDISDLYNVPFDSDIYAVPVDVVRPPACAPPIPPQRPRRHQHHHHHHHRKRRRHASSGSQSEMERQSVFRGRAVVTTRLANGNGGGSKRHSVPSSVSGVSAGGSARQVCSTSSADGGAIIGCTEPVHMTLHEVRQYLQNLYSSSSDSIDNKNKTEAVPSISAPKPARVSHPVTSEPTIKSASSVVTVLNNNTRKHKKSTFVINMKNRKAKELCDVVPQKDNSEKDKVKKSGRHSFSSNLKQTLCSIFRIRKPLSPDHHSAPESVSCTVVASPEVECQAPKAPFLMRALPPLPSKATERSGGADSVCLEPLAPMPSPEEGPSGSFENDVDIPGEELSMDFAASIEKVKDYGWYWGPISGEAAEKVLSNEPDGSFIVRDSSDDHYIFSLTFKLNGCIRHVRIEHDQGNFSFGSCTKFKSHTIVDFIENAVEHSRSGRYLFFLHRRPVLGPMRVQLLHPVSRFKQVQSLQHMCRFVILKLVRRDLIPTLPLPRRLIDYLSTPHYYAEQLLEEELLRGPGSYRSSGTSPSVDEGSPAAAFLPPTFAPRLPSA